MRTIFLTAAVLIFFGVNVVAQNAKGGFFKLSHPERWWVICHPFKAKKAWKATDRTLQITDSIGQTGILGTDLNGGQLDAFKHSFWMIELSRQIGTKAAIALGRAHEKGNYKDFLKGRSEDGSLPDKAASDMDNFNNGVGVELFELNREASERERVEFVINYIIEGKMKILKKNQNQFLTCNGDPVDKKSYLGKWENDKCLVPSNEL